MSVRDPLIKIEISLGDFRMCWKKYSLTDFNVGVDISSNPEEYFLASSRIIYSVSCFSVGTKKKLSRSLFLKEQYSEKKFN